jgi:enoyl-CoA hydratase/carnithine racemase
MLFGEEIKATEAKKLGLVDRIVDEKDLVKEAVKEAKNLVGNTLKISSQINFKDSEKEINDVKSILDNLNKQGKTRNQIQFELCANSIIEGIKKGTKEGLKIEKNNFLKCITHPNSRFIIL